MECVLLHTVCKFYTLCVILHTVCNLRCLVASKFLSRIYALLSVKFPGLKMCGCKKMTNIRYDSREFKVLMISKDAIIGSRDGLRHQIIIEINWKELYTRFFPFMTTPQQRKINMKNKHRLRQNVKR